MEGVDAENSINHAHLLANSESSISKPSAKSSDLRRCKFADVGTSSKFPIEIERHLSNPCNRLNLQKSLCFKPRRIFLPCIGKGLLC